MDELRSRSYYEGRARWYDWANRIAALLRGTSGRRERLKAIARLRLRPGDRVLEVSCGTGTNLLLMQEATGGDGSFTGLDISRGMLLKYLEKARGGYAPARLVEGEAARLPFRDGVFDALLHHGGIAEFGDAAAALAEMSRVTKRGGRIVVCDVGVPTDRRLPLVSRLLMRTQPVYRKPPPVDRLPAGLPDVQTDLDRWRRVVSDRLHERTSLMGSRIVGFGGGVQSGGLPWLMVMAYTLGTRR